MASEDTRDFTYEGTTYSVVARRKNKHRTAVRRVTNALAEAGIDAAYVNEFAAIVTYTVAVNGSGWQPPTSNAAPATLADAYNEWLELDTDLTDAFTAAIYARAVDPVTSPVPPKDDDENL